LFGEYTNEQLYFLGLLVCAGLSILYAFIGELLDFDIDGIFSPFILLIFGTFATANGFLLESYTNLESPIALVIALVISVTLSFLSHNFVIIPLKGAQQSLVFTEKSLEGMVATVITTIPIDGFGEILIKNELGSISKTATCTENKVIAAGTTVMIMEMKDRVAQVVPYKPLWSMVPYLLLS